MGKTQRKAVNNRTPMLNHHIPTKLAGSHQHVLATVLRTRTSRFAAGHLEKYFLEVRLVGGDVGNLQPGRRNRCDDFANAAG